MSFTPFKTYKTLKLLNRYCQPVTVSHPSKLTRLSNLSEDDNLESVVSHPSKLTRLSNNNVSSIEPSKVSHPSKLTRLSNPIPIAFAVSSVSHPSKLTRLSNDGYVAHTSKVVSHPSKLTRLSNTFHVEIRILFVSHPSKLTRLSNLKFQFEVLTEFNILTICCKSLHFYNTTISIDNAHLFAIYSILQHIFYHNQENLFIGTELIEKY